MEYYYPNELYHHGIKGMKWGVRRYQKKDGTLTPAGKKRYSESEGSKAEITKTKSKVTHRDILEKKYRDSGMSEAEAKAAADKRIKVEKVIAVTAGVTVAACAAYYAKNKISQNYFDQVLKAGTTFHNLDATANPRPGEHLYVNYRQNDTDYFRGHFAVGKMRKSGHVFNHTITAKEDIKIPSVNTRKSVFKELYDKDEEFRKVFETHSFRKSELGEGKKAKTAAQTYKAMWRKFGDKDNPEFNTAKHKYFEALRQKGYEAIVDEWDTNPGVFRSDAPLILLNTSSKSLGEMTIKELTEKDVLLAQANSRHYEPTRTLKTLAGLPHTNHFKESEKSLARSAAKSARNKEYIDKYLSEAKKAAEKVGGDKLDAVNSIIRTDTLHEKGKRYADAGRYMSKDSNLTAEEAMRKVTNKEGKQAIATLAAIAYVPYKTLKTADQSIKVRKYLKEHPDTKLTYKQIQKNLKYEKVVQEYFEEHPNSKMNYLEVMKAYYGLNGNKPLYKTG